MWGFNWIKFFGSKVLCVVDTGLYGSGLFRLVFFFLLFSFFFSRLPFVYDFADLFFFLFVIIFTLYFSALGCRFENFSIFLAEFVPEGVSPWFGLSVCMLEFASYLTRPIVLFMRPLVNLGFGSFIVDLYFSSMCCWGVEHFDFNFYWFCLFLLGTIFIVLYEWCVCCVQWYIVEVIVVNESEA